MPTILTIREYISKVKKCTPQAVRKAISKNRLDLLPKVIRFEKRGRDWMLEVKP